MSITAPRMDIKSAPSATQAKQVTIVDVVVALISRPLSHQGISDNNTEPHQDWSSEQEYFIAVRPDGPWVGQWEFPGGKVESDETPYQALVREVKEETAIDVHTAQPFITIDTVSVQNPSVICRLYVWQVRHWTGQPCGAEGQDTRWLRLHWAGKAKFLKPNRHMFTAMRLTSCLLILNCTAHMSEQALLSLMHQWEQLKIKLGGQLSVRLRANGVCADTYYTLVQKVAQHIRSGQVQYIIDALASDAFNNTFFWAENNIMAAYFPSWWQEQKYTTALQDAKIKLQTQAPNLLRGASCHTSVELEWACHNTGVAADFYCLSPVAGRCQPLAANRHAPADSAQGSLALDLEQWSIVNQQQEQPGYALGGMTLNDLVDVKNAGGFGIAGIRCFDEIAPEFDWQHIQQQLAQSSSNVGDLE